VPAELTFESDACPEGERVENPEVEVELLGVTEIEREDAHAGFR
jgi:hypothetical protein